MIDPIKKVNEYIEIKEKSKSDENINIISLFIDDIDNVIQTDPFYKYFVYLSFFIINHKSREKYQNIYTKYTQMFTRQKYSTLNNMINQEIYSSNILLNISNLNSNNWYTIKKGGNPTYTLN